MPSEQEKIKNVCSKTSMNILKALQFLWVVWILDEFLLGYGNNKARLDNLYCKISCKTKHF